jgi:hypothetical protein
MYLVVEVESRLADDISDLLNEKEQEGWSLVTMTADIPGTPAYCVFHKLAEAPKAPEATVVNVQKCPEKSIG